MPPLLERLGVELPVVQAGMGGGLSRHELAAARALTGRLLAVNVLLPFARRDWFEAAAEADFVVTFWGRPRRRTPGAWLHQCGSVAEAREAQAAGADGVIVQGVEAGGHVRGTTPALQLLEETRTALPSGYPLLLAGGVAEAGDVRVALEAGSTAAVAGTRFLLAEESRAHPLYKERLLAADETLLTDLFGAGWPAPHRVVPNAATARQLGGVRPFRGISTGKDERRVVFRAPSANRALNRLMAPGVRYPPASLQLRMMRAQRPGSRILTPAGPTDDGPASLVDAGALYAGETVARIEEIRPAAAIVRDLAG
ncbi:MAG TPA: nitronate monooxygenase [Solirubrobacterales bacterium]|nr:nitronate monooxygenase [Solirubrobacterales bacterium]